MKSRSALYSILIGGAIMGLLGNLPVINLVNCVLCIWVWLGGAAAVVLFRRFEKTTTGPSTGRGAGLGALAGVVGAFIGALVYLPTAAISGPIMQSVMQSLNVQDVPVPQSGAGGLLGGMLIWLLIDIVLYPLFGALSGLVTASILNRNSAKPAG